MISPKPSLLERLRGATVEVELPGPGGVVRRTVSKKWFDAMASQGRIRRVDESAGADSEENSSAGELAERLVRTVRLVVATTADDLPQIEASLAWAQERKYHWHLVLTIAALGFAIFEYRERPAVLQALDRVVERELPRGMAAIKDFTEFLKRNRQEGIGFAEATGLWVLWNVKGTEDPPTYEESKGVRVVGEYVSRIAANWESAPM